jgi:hypothetical protein
VVLEILKHGLAYVLLRAVFEREPQPFELRLRRLPQGEIVARYSQTLCEREEVTLQSQCAGNVLPSELA